MTFDRIRENIRANWAALAKGLPGKDLSQIIDLSIAQTMPRTALTTGTVFLTVLVLVLFGGDALYAFSLTMLVGLISGTYSSIFVASPLLLSFKGAVEPPKPVDDEAAKAEGDAQPVTG